MLRIFRPNSTSNAFNCENYVLIQKLQNCNIYIMMATAQGKQGIWLSLFPDRENTGNLGTTQGNFRQHREILDNTGNFPNFSKN